MALPVLHRDDDLIIVSKPSGLFVHRTALDPSATEFALQIVRNQIKQNVYPVHRLDRATSGALIFALSKPAARGMMESFAAGKIEKTYMAVVRGIPDPKVHVDYPLKELHKPAQSAITEIETLKAYEFPVKVDKYPSSRYALIKAMPKTGRMHQIRKHLHHLNHPIIGDSTYGSGKHNRFFKTTFNIGRLMLACTELVFSHPISLQRIQVTAPLAEEFERLLLQMKESEATGLLKP